MSSYLSLSLIMSRNWQEEYKGINEIALICAFYAFACKSLCKLFASPGFPWLPEQTDRCMFSSWETCIFTTFKSSHCSDFQTKHISFSFRVKWFTSSREIKWFGYQIQLASCSRRCCKGFINSSFITFYCFFDLWFDKKSSTLCMSSPLLHPSLSSSETDKFLAKAYFRK